MPEPRPNYTNFELRQELTKVFDSVWFEDKNEKRLLQDSYFLSFSSMIKYARESDIDAKEYVHEIKSILLTIPRTRDRLNKNYGR